MFAEDIKKLTKKNTNFRNVLHTGTHCQIVAMNIPVGGDIGEETHLGTDQIIFVVEGQCEATINSEVRRIDEHDVAFVPAGAVHNFKNTGSEALKIFTVYAPPEHPPGTVYATKDEAEKGE